MNAETKILTPSECLQAMNFDLNLMLNVTQAMLEKYPMDTMTRSDLGVVRMYLKKILED